MAKRNKKKKQKIKYDQMFASVPSGHRNWTAVAAFQRGGGGQHQDGRLRRKRTRGAQKRAALAEYN